MGIFADAFKRNLEIRDALDLDIIGDPSQRAYLKRIALDTCINFIARTFSQSEFWVQDNKKSLKNTLYYKLNVRPNTDSNATNFWNKVIYKLIYDNEVLIIKTDSDDLMIADDFSRKEYAVYDDIFEDVIVKDYKFERQFKMSEVLYLEYNNEKLQRYVNDLFGDYGELFGRMMDTQLRKNQIRGMVGIKTGGGQLDDKSMTRLQKYINRIYTQFKDNGVAIVPKVDGFDYEELSNNNNVGTDNGADNLTKVKRLFIDDVAKIIGIPPALIHGDMADLEKLMDAYLDFCINPLIKMIENELNSKFYSPDEYLKGKKIKVIGINKQDPIKNSAAIDKLISSNFAEVNEVREMFGLERRDGLDIFLRTKNYQESNETEALKGGDNK
ncbi:phage portal protein [Macrococcus hajekii]|uniref:Phage portal protein n=1 Tax=Macrococcus hajekii TaxID=198482 RepID=A0A4R6BNX8_9STAP|nr:phage portal protein [Macrococcus hajekii]TDM03541.1 phage portal protein [Macrococcus hajekii]GGA99691.1 phage portal protein [Macrococcus hajekii]